MPDREDNSSSSTASVPVLLREMNNIDRVYMIATTNLPWKIDEAFRRRLQKIVLVDLPSVEDRALMIRKYLKGKNSLLVKADVQCIAERTANYSGADLENLTMTAAEFAYDRSMKATHCILRGEDYYPCHKNERGAMLINDDIKATKTNLLSPIYYCDFVRALRCTKANVDLGRLQKVRDFAASYGVK